MAPFNLRLHMCFTRTAHCNTAHVVKAQTTEHLQAIATETINNGSYDYNKTIWAHRWNKRHLVCYLTRHKHVHIMQLSMWPVEAVSESEVNWGFWSPQQWCKVLKRNSAWLLFFHPWSQHQKYRNLLECLHGICLHCAKAEVHWEDILFSVRDD